MCTVSAPNPRLRYVALLAAGLVSLALPPAAAWADDTKSTGTFHFTDGQTEMDWDASGSCRYYSYPVSGQVTQYWFSRDGRNVTVVLSTREGHPHDTAYYRATLWYGSSQIWESGPTGSSMAFRELDGSPGDTLSWENISDFQGSEEVDCKLKVQSGPHYSDLGSSLSPAFLHNSG